MSVMDATIFSVFSFALVFAILIVLILILQVISKLVTTIEKKMKGGEPAPTVTPAPVPVSAPAAPVAAEPAPAVRLEGVDEQTAAIIMAIVSYNSGIPLERLRFNSIRAVN